MVFLKPKEEQVKSPGLHTRSLPEICNQWVRQQAFINMQPGRMDSKKSLPKKKKKWRDISCCILMTVKKPVNTYQPREQIKKALWCVATSFNNEWCKFLRKCHSFVNLKLPNDWCLSYFHISVIKYFCSRSWGLTSHKANRK